MKLQSLYGYNYPDRDEMIWQYVGMDDFEEEDFPVVEIDPVEIFETWTTDGIQTYKQVMERYASKEQKKTINYYKRNIDETRKSIVVISLSSKEIIDGHHRIAAMALKGETRMMAIDLSGEE